MDQDTLKFEMLRMRAAIERTELRAAVLELRNATRPLRGLLGVVTGVAQGIEARRSGLVSLAGTVFGLLRDRPWLLSALATIAARRGVPRWLLLGAGAAAVAASTAWLVRGAKAVPNSETSASR